LLHHGGRFASESLADFSGIRKQTSNAANNSAGGFPTTVYAISFFIPLPGALLQATPTDPAHASLRDVMRKIGNGLWSLNIEL
jgi:hypothetical protein